jgi:hypothetical protein
MREIGTHIQDKFITGQRRNYRSRDRAPALC